MPNTVKIVAIAAGSVIAYRLVTHPLRQKANANRDVALLLIDELTSSKKRMEYLAHLIDEHGGIDEFDIIALSNM